MTSNPNSQINQVTALFDLHLYDYAGPSCHQLFHTCWSRNQSQLLALALLNPLEQAFPPSRISMRERYYAAAMQYCSQAPPFGGDGVISPEYHPGLPKPYF